MFRAAGCQLGEMFACNDIGFSHALLGNYQQAISYCERSLAAAQQIGERNWESASWDTLGYVYHQIGDCHQAIVCYDRAVAICRELGDRFNEADALAHLGDAHSSAGDLDAARLNWSQALRIFEEIDHPDGDAIRDKLRLADSLPDLDDVLAKAVPVGAGRSPAVML
jgi:tetratricopeptide (TPR) repeat protein